MQDDAKALLASIWGNTLGYAFICSIDWKHGHAFNPGKAFRWPIQRHDLSAYADELAAKGHDVYFTPALFSKPERKTEAAMELPLIWADVDEAPIDVVRSTHPTALWQTSPGRHQAVWRVDTPLPIADDLSLARAASHILGCDPSGWDATQLLRLPGYESHKRPQGFLVGDLETDKPQRVTRLVGRLYATLSYKQAKYQGRMQAASPAGDRSRVLFDLARHLLTGGMEAQDVAGLLRHTVWNKWETPQELLKDVERIRTRLPKEPEPEATEDDVEPLEPTRARLTLRSLDEILDQRKPEWLIQGLVERRSCGFIAGPPKQFKSWVMLDMAVSMAAGGRCLDRFKCVRKPTLIVEAEDNFARLAQRLDIVTACRFPDANPHGKLDYRDGAVLWLPPSDRIPLYIVSQPPMGFGPDFYEDLAELIQEHGIKLAVYDTLSMLTGESLNDSQAMYSTVLRPLKQIANELDCAQMLVHHTRKASVGLANTGGAALAGSVALHAWSDNSIYLQRMEGGTALAEVESKAQASQTFELSQLNTPGKWLPVVADHVEETVAEL